MTHTPTPWTMIQLPDFRWRIDARQGPLHVCPAIANGSDDAALIVRAVNCHDELVTTLKAVGAFLSDKRIGTVAYMEGPDFYMDCDKQRRLVVAALAKAETP